MDPNQTWIDLVNVVGHELNDPNYVDAVIGSAGLNLSIGLPPRAPQLGNAPVTPMSGSSHSSSSMASTTTQVVGETNETPNKQVKKPRIIREHKADCWSIFKEVKDADNVTVGGICLICKKECKYKGETGTGTLRKHKAGHDKRGEYVSEEFSTQMVQTQLGVGGGYFRYDPDKVRKGLIKYCVRLEKPLSMVVDPFFEEFIRDCLHPQYKKSYKKKVRDDLMNQFWIKRAELYDEFKEAKHKVAVTSDIWTAGKHNLAYCSVTAHWISEDTNIGCWILNKRILAFRVLDYPHDARSIFEYILSVLDEYHIRDKVFAMAFDNASNNNAALRLLANTLQPICDGIFFHTKCACHILNLMVHAGLKPEPIEKLLHKYKEALRFLDSSVKKKQSFAEVCNRMKVPVVKIPWDVDTRWNSTYRLLKKTLHLKPAIDQHLSNSVAGQEFQLTFEEWRSLEHMIPFLECFYVATVRLSASYTPTSSALLEELVTISDWYATQMSTLRDSSILWFALQPIREKFLKYWQDVPKLTIIASCLDPRWKVHTTADLLTTMKKNFGLDANNVHEEVSCLFENVYKVYEQQYQEARAAHGNLGVSQASNPARRGRSAVSHVRNILNKQGNAPSSSSQQVNNSEIQVYTSSISSYANVNLDDENFDILQFWNQAKAMFPILASMAQDVFAAPVSTVASESCFSAANRVLTDKRTRLGPSTFEALVLHKDWYDAEKRLQDRSWMHMPSELREEANTSSAGPSQQAQEVDQPHEEQQQYGYNPYMENYEEYGFPMNNQNWDN